MIKRALALLALASVSLQAQVSFDRLLQTDREPHNWLTYSGGLSSQRHSLLTQINPGNVKRLELQWVFQARSLEKFETTPLVVDGVMYTVQAPNDIVALDAVTGRTFWVYSYRPALESRPCCGRLNRGVAILDGTLFMGTIDGHVVAVDATTGRQVWDTAIAQTRGRLFSHCGASRRQRQSDRRHGGRRVTASEVSLPPTIPGRGKKRGASTRSRGRARPATKPGAVIPGRPVAAPSGSPARPDPDLNLVVLGHGQRGTGLERRLASRRQSLHLLGRGAGRRHGQAEVAFSILAA